MGGLMTRRKVRGRRWKASALGFPRRWPRARTNERASTAIPSAPTVGDGSHNALSEPDSNDLSERYEHPYDPYEDPYDPYETDLLVERARMREQAGDYGGALTILAWIAERSGSAGAEGLYWQAADAGNARALTILGWRLEEAGDREAAVQLYRQAAQAGDENAMRILERWQEETGGDTDVQ
jgi:TPR repeat protein